MHLRALAKPQFIFRPRQILLRLIRELDRRHVELADVRLPWNLTIRVNPNEVIGRAIRHHGLYDLAVSEALWRLLDPGSIALDIGANIGYTTSIMARKTGRAGTVIAFEPHPGLFKSLERNVARFKQQSSIAAIVPLNIALSDDRGASYLAYPEQFQANQGIARITDEPLAGRVAVQKTTLDAVLGAARIALMKIDVEGHELQVLRGAKNILQRQSVRQIIYEDLGGNASPVHPLLASYGYSIYALGWNVGKPLVTPLAEGPQIHSGYEAPNYLATIDAPDVLARFQRWGWQVL